MSWEQWGPALVSSGVVGGLGLLGSHFLKSTIEKGVQHGFDREIEKLRADLRTKETEIKDLRAGALAALSSRHEELDKRRIKAAEALWAATVEQARYKMAVTFIAHMNLEAIFASLNAKTGEGAKLAAFGEVLWTASGLEKILADAKPNAMQERLFVAPKAWAAFAALQGISSYAVAALGSIRTGGVLTLKKIEETNAIVKSALPHRSEYIDKFPQTAIWMLVDELVEKILSELIGSLEMAATDMAAVKQASRILRIAAEENQPQLPPGLDEKFRTDPPPLE